MKLLPEMFKKEGYNSLGPRWGEVWRWREHHLWDLNPVLPPTVTVAV